MVLFECVARLMKIICTLTQDKDKINKNPKIYISGHGLVLLKRHLSIDLLFQRTKKFGFILDA